MSFIQKSNPIVNRNLNWKVNETINTKPETESYSGIYIAELELFKSKNQNLKLKPNQEMHLNRNQKVYQKPKYWQNQN